MYFFFFFNSTESFGKPSAIVSLYVSLTRGKTWVFSERAHTQAKAQATLLSKNKETCNTGHYSQIGNADLTCFATDLSLCYDSLDSIIHIAVHYDLLSLNCLLGIQPNEKRKKKTQTLFNYIAFKGNGNSPCNLNAILKCFYLFPLIALFCNTQLSSLQVTLG